MSSPMNLSLLIQYGVIALAVLFSAGDVVQKQWPHALRAVRVHCAVPLVREGRAAWLRNIGRAIAPAPRPVGEVGCSGCHGCGPGSS